MDIHIYIRLLSDIQCIFNFKAMTAGNSQTGQQLIQICRTIRRTHFYSLLLAGVKMAFGFQRIS